MKSKAILVLTTPRTGSNHLTRLMNNFTNVDVNWEIFGYDSYNIKPCYRKICENKFGKEYEMNIRKNNLQLDLIRLIIDACDKEYLIFKIFMGDYSDEENHITRQQIIDLINNKIVEHVIIINRKNKIDQYISLQKALKLQKWDSFDTSNTKINFDTDAYTHYKKRHVEIYDFYHKINENNNILDLTYENDICSTEHLLTKINNFIVKLLRKKGYFEKGFEKQDTITDYEYKILNYNDENNKVKDFIKDEVYSLQT
jgi:hypothetical protein